MSNTSPTNYMAFAAATTAINDGVISALRAVAVAKDAETKAGIELASAKTDAWNDKKVTGTNEETRKASLEALVTPQRVVLEETESNLRAATLELDVAKEMAKWLDRQMTIYGWKLQYPQAAIDANVDSVQPVMAYIKQLEDKIADLEFKRNTDAAIITRLEAYIDEASNDELPFDVDEEAEKVGL
jgi:hypothetical protein